LLQLYSEHVMIIYLLIYRACACPILQGFSHWLLTSEHIVSTRIVHVKFLMGKILTSDLLSELFTLSLPNFIPHLLREKNKMMLK
jgi:hypothetical protein